MCEPRSFRDRASDYGDMSNEHGREEYWKKFSDKFEGFSCAGTRRYREEREETREDDDFSRRTIKRNVAINKESLKNLSRCRAQEVTIVEQPGKQRYPERTSGGGPSLRTVEISHDNFLSRSGESSSECINVEGSCSWESEDNVDGYPNLQAIWNLKDSSLEIENCPGEDGRSSKGIGAAEGGDWKASSDEDPSDVLNEYSIGGNNSETSGSAVDVSQTCFEKLEKHGNHSPWRLEISSPRTPTFANLALSVSYAGLDTSGFFDARSSSSKFEDDSSELWEDFSVVECLESKSSCDESTPEERVEALKEILAESDIHEGNGVVSDFLFHVARTKYGKIYIRVIRTMLLNRGRISIIFFFFYIDFFHPNCVVRKKPRLKRF